MKILMLSPELAPYAKTGGLGDMVASLSKALAQSGHDVRVCIPLYGNIKPAADWKAFPYPVAVHLTPQNTQWARVWEAPLAGGAKVIFLEYNNFFAGTEVYGNRQEQGYRFAFQTLAAFDFCLQSKWIPDVVHAHDWTAGFAPVILNTTRRHTAIGRAASVYTVHNLQHQGLVPADLIRYLGLPAWLNTADNLECYGDLNMMKGALYHSTKITTVSPTYAKEIQTPAYGFGLDGVLRHRWSDLTGIVNGIDPDEWNPATDKNIPANFTAEKLAGKAECKTALQQALGLDVTGNVPVFGIVARLYDQKGLDLLAEILPALLEKAHMQIALLGSGEKWLELRFRNLAEMFPKKCGVSIGYDNKLAHLIEAGSDFFLMPSRFEPCGLNQLYSMRYGTLPIARATGGLADTIEQWTSNPAGGTGILFRDADTGSLLDAVYRALRLYFDNTGDFHALRQIAMKKDFTWEKSAKTYERVYQDALSMRAGAFGKK